MVRLVEKEDSAQKAPGEEGPDLRALLSGEQILRWRSAGRKCTWECSCNPHFRKGRKQGKIWQRKKVGGSAILMNSSAGSTDSTGSSEARSGCP